MNFVYFFGALRVPLQVSWQETCKRRVLWFHVKQAVMVRKDCFLFVLLFSWMPVFSSALPDTTEVQGREGGSWYFGIGGGFHTTATRYSVRDKAVFPHRRNCNSGEFSLFAEYDWGMEHRLAIRPEIAFMKRGGRLDRIRENTYERNGLRDIRYTFNASYLDIRLPFIWQFLRQDAVFRPYVYISPVAGFVLKGRVETITEYDDGSFEGYGLAMDKGNMATAYFAGAVGLGAKWQFNLNGMPMFLGMEVSYELGFTDTYSAKEKAGDVSGIVPGGTTLLSGSAEGNRKFSGFEIKLNIGIPFQVFGSRKADAGPDPLPIPQQPVQTAPVQNPCFSLSEFIALMQGGEDLKGKTICAINAIHFDFGSSVIRKESYAYLDSLAQVLIQTGCRIEVKGHTDNVGSEKVNLKLSKERSEAVVHYLERKGVGKDKLTYSYYGMTRPLSTNETEEGRIMNRRVEFEILN